MNPHKKMFWTVIVIEIITTLCLFGIAKWLNLPYHIMLMILTWLLLVEVMLGIGQLFRIRR